MSFTSYAAGAKARDEGTFVSPGFRGRPREHAPGGRIPPGQYVVRDLPVLSAGPTPHIPLNRWTFSITGEVDAEKRWTWDEFRKLPFSDGGYTANLPLEDITGGKAWVAFAFDGAPLAPEHGGPARLLVPHLSFWKSAKWVRGLRLMTDNEQGFWEMYGYHMYGDPWQEQRYSGD